MGEEAEDDLYRAEVYDDDDICPACAGRGTVNPCTPLDRLPRDFLCLGTTTCPRCDGSGRDD